jgi:hypothetical protein
LIAPYVGHDHDWDKRIVQILWWGKAYKSDAMTAIYFDLIGRGIYDEFESPVAGDSRFWSQLYNAEKECPKFIIDVLAKWFERAIEQYDDGESWNALGECHQNHSHVGAQLVGKAAANEPVYFVEKMLPLAVRAILRTEIRPGDRVQNRVWPYLDNNGDPFNIDDAVLLHLRKSLQWLAKHDIALFRKHASTIAMYPHETFGYLLLRAWADNPEEFANECVAYLVADQTRLNIGYGSWSGDEEGTGESAITRIALQAVSPHCSDELLHQLEIAIIGYCDEYEKQTPRWRGYAELLVLRSLDRSRISKRAALRIEELERKFPDLSDAIVREDEISFEDFVGSPIPEEIAELMTDNQWISAMQKYDGSTDRFRGRQVELSRSLAEFTRKNRPRFASLMRRIPDNVDPIYFSAILDGLCGRFSTLGKAEQEADQKIIDATPTETFVTVIERLHSLPNRPCGSAIIGCIRTLSDRQFPSRVLDIASFYATSDPDPETDIWQDTLMNYYGGEPYSHGIHCVRGQAAEAIASLLYRDEARLEFLRPALIALSQDPIISVRTRAINAFMRLLNFARDEAIELFLKACEGCTTMCSAPSFERFIHYAVHTHYPQLREILQFALGSDNEDAVENAARQITLADLVRRDRCWIRRIEHSQWNRDDA